PRRRCRHKRLTDRLKPSDGCCQNCASWSDTSAALLRGETKRFSISSQSRARTTTFSCKWQNEANFSQFVQRLENPGKPPGAATRESARRSRSAEFITAFP